MDFIEANGAGLRCELSGGGDRTLVLVHEMGGSLESWDDVAPRFAVRYDVPSECARLLHDGAIDVGGKRHDAGAKRGAQPIGKMRIVDKANG